MIIKIGATLMTGWNRGECRVSSEHFGKPYVGFRCTTELRFTGYLSLTVRRLTLEESVYSPLITVNEMGVLLGVSSQSVYKWEQGKAKPRASQLKAIAAVRKLGKQEVAERLAQ